jgi:hypothetical protein
MNKLAPGSDVESRGKLTVQLVAMPRDTNAKGDI